MDEEKQRDDQSVSTQAVDECSDGQVSSAPLLDVEPRLENRGNYSYLQSGQYSDLTIVDRAGRRWQVHKVIVCSECEFFANAIKGGFKEAETGVIELPNDDPAAVRALLEYIYAKDYNPIRAAELNYILMFHVEVYIIGEIYNMPDLKDLAFDHIVSMLVCIKPSCYMVVPIVKRIYESTPESDRRIRDFLLDVSLVHIHGLLVMKKFLNVMVEYPAFRRGIAQGVLQGQERIDCYGCDYITRRSRKR
ncbi:hypothetical protein IWZ01DRAFT_559536 [Phyllosticta capitalensis]